MPLTRRLVASLLFPTVLAAGVGVTIALMHRGVAPSVAFVGPVLASYLLLMTLERVIPHHEAWKHSRGDLRVDILHLIISGAFTLEMLRPFVLALAVAGAGWLSGVLGATLWPTSWPLVAQLALALVVGELSMYWVHRWAHTWEPLWRLHAVHHSAPRLYFLNAVRFHPLDLAISTFAPLLCLVILGAGEPLLALFTLATAIHGLFQHTNLPVRLGPLNWVFSMAELHRWHHSPVLAETNTNFGQNLIVWDVVFGTRFLPADREPPEAIGIGDQPAFPMDYLGQLLSPFTWRRIQRQNRALQARTARAA